MLTDYSRLFFISLLQIWWIALWGIAYIVIEYVSNKNRNRSIYLYSFINRNYFFISYKSSLIKSYLNNII